MDEPCSCKHLYELHRTGGGRCLGLDSYSIPCECPSYEPISATFTEDDEDEL